MLLSAFRADPSDTYLLQVGFAGASAPLASINEAGFAAASFHSWPATLAWDAYSGDYGPGFLGTALAAGTYVARHAAWGLLAYGGVLQDGGAAGRVSVQTTGPVSRRVFIGPLGVMVSADAGSIKSFSFDEGTGTVALTLTQLPDAPRAAAAVLWVEANDKTAAYRVAAPAGVTQERLGWKVPLPTAGDVVVELTRS